MEEEKKIDYRALLVKYMDLVSYCEGITFVDSAQVGEFGMTQEEVDELRRIEQEPGSRDE